MARNPRGDRSRWHPVVRRRAASRYRGNRDRRSRASRSPSSGHIRSAGRLRIALLSRVWPAANRANRFAVPGTNRSCPTFIQQSNPTIAFASPTYRRTRIWHRTLPHVYIRSYFSAAWNRVMKSVAPRLRQSVESRVYASCIINYSILLFTRNRIDSGRGEAVKTICMENTRLDNAKWNCEKRSRRQSNSVYRQTISAAFELHHSRINFLIVSCPHSHKYNQLQLLAFESAANAP